MAGFQVSPGVQVNEIDLTNIVSQVASSPGAIAGLFRWGPVNVPSLISSELVLVNRFGRPTNYNAETFFVAADFLSYGGALNVVRAANTTGFSNTATVTLTTNTSGTIASPNTGLSNNLAVFGAGIVAGTLLSNVSANATTTSFTLTQPTTNTTPGSLLFYSPNTVFTAIANTSPIAKSLSTYIVKSQSVYPLVANNFEVGTVEYVAKWPGAIGNSLLVSQCGSATQYSSNINLLNYNGNTSGNNILTALSINTGTNFATVLVANNTGANDIVTTTLANTIASAISVGDYVLVGNTSIGTRYMQVNSVSSVVTVNTVVNSVSTNTGSASFTLTFNSPYALSSNLTMTSFTRNWQYFNNVPGAPGQSAYQAALGNTAANDQLHVVVVDQDGLFTGVPGQILETFSNLSRATDNQNPDGTNNYYATVINGQSNYVWYASDRSKSPSNTSLLLTSSLNITPMTLSFVAGSDGDGESTVSFGTLANGIDTFADVDNIDISLIMTGKSLGGISGEQSINYIIDNITSSRLDCVAFASAPANTVVQAYGALPGTQLTNVLNWANNVRPSSYAVLDTGYYYRYDKYNDLYRWIPLNGDTAGCCVFTDQVRDPWFSPGGFQRGQMKYIIRLAWNPIKAERNILYPAGINPVVSFKGQGTILYGDKTHLIGDNSAFSRIGVRRLFITLEKAIAKASQFLLFEFNDIFTQTQFTSTVNPYLRDVKGRRGVTDYAIDLTGNTPQVVDSEQFVGNIYIKPNRSINYVTLNFIATPSGVSFNEVIGKGIP
jgi:hypothetical protein